MEKGRSCLWPLENHAMEIAHQLVDNREPARIFKWGQKDIFPPWPLWKKKSLDVCV